MSVVESVPSERLDATLSQARDSVAQSPTGGRGVSQVAVISRLARAVVVAAAAAASTGVAAATRWTPR